MSRTAPVSRPSRPPPSAHEAVDVDVDIDLEENLFVPPPFLEVTAALAAARPIPAPLSPSQAPSWEVLPDLRPAPRRRGLLSSRTAIAVGLVGAFVAGLLLFRSGGGLAPKTVAPAAVVAPTPEPAPVVVPPAPPAPPPVEIAPSEDEPEPEPPVAAAPVSPPRRAAPAAVRLSRPTRRSKTPTSAPASVAPRARAASEWVDPFSKDPPAEWVDPFSNGSWTSLPAKR